MGKVYRTFILGRDLPKYLKEYAKSVRRSPYYKLVIKRSGDILKLSYIYYKDEGGRLKECDRRINSIKINPRGQYNRRDLVFFKEDICIMFDKNYVIDEYDKYISD